MGWCHRASDSSLAPSGIDTRRLHFVSDPKRFGARLRLECTLVLAGSTPVVDMPGIAGWSRPVFCTDGEGDRYAPAPSSPPLGLRVVTTDVMPIRNRLPLSGCRFDSCCSRTPSLVVQWLSTFLSHGKDSSSILLEATNLGLETAVVRSIRNRLPLCGSRFDSWWSRQSDQASWCNGLAHRSHPTKIAVQFCSRLLTNLGLETAVVMPIRNRLPLYGCRFDSCWSRRQAS